MSGWVAVLGLAAGCAGADRGPAGDPGGALEETGGSAVDDTGDAAPTATIAVTDAAARLHDEIGSLVAVSWTQDGPATVWVEFGLEGEDAMTSPPVAREAGAQEALLLGLPFGATASWSVVWDAGDGPVVGAAGTVETGPLPLDLLAPEVRVADLDRLDPDGRWLLGSVNERIGGWAGGPFWRFILDRQGRAVWAVEVPDDRWTLQQRVSADGASILWDEDTFWSDWDGGEGSRVHRSSIDGTLLETMETPGLHHDFEELPDGTLIWAASVGWTDDLMVLAPGQAEPETLWRCADWLADLGVDYACHSNTISYDAETDTLLFSLYSVETVVAIDATTAETLWWAGDLAGGYDFADAETAFAWQHGAHITAARTLLLSAKSGGRGEEETVAREYELDHDARLLTQIWSFGEGEDVYGDQGGEAWRLANGNTLHNYGTAGRVKEVTAAGEVVWDLDWGGKYLLGRTILVEDLYALLP